MRHKILIAGLIVALILVSPFLAIYLRQDIKLNRRIREWRPEVYHPMAFGATLGALGQPTSELGSKVIEEELDIFVELGLDGGAVVAGVPVVAGARQGGDDAGGGDLADAVAAALRGVEASVGTPDDRVVLQACGVDPRAWAHCLAGAGHQGGCGAAGGADVGTTSFAGVVESHGSAAQRSFEWTHCQGD